MLKFFHFFSFQLYSEANSRVNISFKRLIVTFSAIFPSPANISAKLGKNT